MNQPLLYSVSPSTRRQTRFVKSIGVTMGVGFCLLLGCLFVALNGSPVGAQDQDEIQRKLDQYHEQFGFAPQQDKQKRGMSPFGFSGPAQDDQILPPELLDELFRGMNEEMRRQIEGAGRVTRSVDRDRDIDRHERIHRTELRKYNGVVADIHQSIVRIEYENEQIALGTIVDEDGYVVTKASELFDATSITCALSDGSRHEAEVVAADQDFDVALLKIDASELTPVEWTTGEQPIGTMIVVSDETGDPLTAGVISVEPRALVNSNQAVLGVRPQPSPRGVLIDTVMPGTAAEEAGLLDGDIALKIDDVDVSTVNGFTNRIRLYEPGDIIRLRIVRDGEEMDIDAVLGGRSFANPFAQGMENRRFGSEPSRRSNDFPIVLQHDAHLWPEQCGGPLVNLDGQIVGLNIARGDRVSSFAIPSATCQELVDELLASVQ